MLTFKIQNTNLEKLDQLSFPSEKVIEDLISSNLEIIFKIKKISNQVVVDNFRIDTLAYDASNHSFVIIEYKNLAQDGIVEQGLAYKNLLSQYIDKFIRIANKMSIDIDEYKLDKSSFRVIFISPEFTKNQLASIKTIQDDGYPLEFWKITNYRNEIMVLEKLSSNMNEYSKSNFIANIDPKRSVEVKEILSEADRLLGRKAFVIDAYNKIKSVILEFDDIQIVERKQYIAFVGSSNICDIVIYNSGLTIWINLKKGELEDIDNITKDYSSRGHWGNGDYCISIDKDKVLNENYMSKLKNVIRQSYLKNKA